MEKVGLNRNAIRRIIYAVFSISIGICVAVVMFNEYSPRQNSLGALGSVCMDIICIINILILLCSFAFDSGPSNKTTRMFAGLLVGTMWALFLDFLNWAYDGSLIVGEMTFWFTVGSLCMGSILGSLFSLYLGSYMEEIHGLSKIHISAVVCAIVNLVSFVVTFVLALTGTAFVFVDGHYEVGALYDMVTVLPVLTLLYLSGYIIRYAHKVGIHDVLAVVGYILLMITGALIEGALSVGTTYVAVSVADIFIFVMLQNEIIAQEKRNVQVWMKKSNTDELTGFFNRSAYESDIKILEEGAIDDNFVYVSVDVNSLKNVNDSFGHNAGDELLIGAADCLKKCFEPYGKVYRTGGDEFIALIFADEEQLTAIKKEIEELTGKWNGKSLNGLALSCGYVTRKEDEKMTLRQMAVLADRRMYEAKDEYYKRTGIERRRKQQ